MTTVRIVPVRYIRPARAPDGSAVPGWWPHQRLIVLADTVPAKDGGHRAVPLWLVAGHKGLLGRLGQPAPDAEVASGLLETAVRLLGTAGTAVSAVDIEPASDDVPELRSDTVTARVGLATAAGSRAVTVGAEYGLALAAVAGAPVRVADAVMDRLAVPVPGEDVLAPFLPPEDARPPGRPARRFEPRNMAFTDGLDHWELSGSFSDDGQPAGHDYSCTAADRSAVLAATVPEPVGSAVLVQARLHLAVSGSRSGSMATRPLLGHGSSPAAPGSSDWTWHEVAVPVPGDAVVIRFGISLAGDGRIELRNAELTVAQPGTQR